jgi:IPT/TIG domain
MSEALQALASATGKAATVSVGLKWGAVGSGVGLLVLVYLATAIFAGRGYWNPWKIVAGADGSSSTSKFQWFLWLIVILFSYTALWVLRAEQGNYSAISQVPVNLLTVLGFSTGTAAAAKGITSGYVQTGRLGKTTAAQAAAAQASAAQAAAPAGPAQGGAKKAKKGGILADDNGVPDLSKIQMIGFTLIAIAIFLTTVIHQIAADPANTSLPNIDSSLLVLMGISQGGYLGKKLVTFGTPTLYPPTPASRPAGTSVTMAGANLGSSPGSQLTVNGTPIGATITASQVTFTVPGNDPATGNPWKQFPQQVQLAVSAMGQTSNTIPFTITA